MSIDTIIILIFVLAAVLCILYLNLGGRAKGN